MRFVKSKKPVILGLVFLTFVAIAIISLLVHNPVHAAKCGDVETSLLECSEGKTDGSTIRDILIIIVNAVTIGFGILTVIGIAVVGIQYLTSGGNEQKATMAKHRMFNISIGIVAFVLLFAIVRWLLPGNLLGDVEISNVSITQRSISLKTGDSTSLQVSVYPLDAKSNNLTYTSDNADVATIDSSGKINAKSPGTATITVTAPNGTSTSTTITVNKPEEVAKEEKPECKPPSSTGSDITIIGDSMMQYSEDFYHMVSGKWSQVDVYRQNSKHFWFDAPGNESGLTILSRVVSENKLRRILVFQLGGNDAADWAKIQQEHIDKLLSLASKADKIILITNYKANAPDRYNYNNDLFRRASEQNEKIYLADWKSKAMADPGKYIQDEGGFQIHPTREGTQLMLDLINETASKCK